MVLTRFKDESPLQKLRDDRVKIMNLHVRRELIYISASVFLDDIMCVEI